MMTDFARSGVAVIHNDQEHNSGPDSVTRIDYPTERRGLNAGDIGNCGKG